MEHPMKTSKINIATHICAVDTENVYGIMGPWQEGFYSTCSAIFCESDHKLHWLDHCTEPPSPGFLRETQDVFDNSPLVVAHNWKYDINVYRWLGLNIDKVNLYDTMVAEYLINGQNKDVSYKLSDLAKRYELEPKYDRVRAFWEDGVETRDIPVDVLEEYVLHDAELALQIYHIQKPILEDLNLTKLVALQSEYIKVLSDIEYHGFIFDAKRAAGVLQEYNARLVEIVQEIKDISDMPFLNLSSAQHKSAMLFGGEIKVPETTWEIKTLKSKPVSYYREVTRDVVKQIEGLGFQPPSSEKKGKSGAFSASRGVVEQLTCGGKGTDRRRKIRVKELLLEHSTINKLVNSLLGKSGDTGLITKIAGDGRVHPSMNNIVTATGRLSSSNPNSQNFPREGTSPIKLCIVPEFDGIYQIDLSQIEWRAAAFLSNDTVMIDEINSGIDQHAKAVTDLMELEFISKSDPKSKENRNHAKVFNFRMIYGGSPYGFYLDYKMPNFSKTKWNRIVNKFFEKYSGLKDWQDRNIIEAQRTGILALPTGRRFHFRKDTMVDGMLTWNERQFKNYPVQGIAGGDILPLLAVIIRRGCVAAGLRSKIILTVHDSLVFDYVEEELERLNKLCLTVASSLPKYIESFFGFKWTTKIDAESEIGPNYGSLKGYDETC